MLTAVLLLWSVTWYQIGAGPVYIRSSDRETDDFSGNDAIGDKEHNNDSGRVEEVEETPVCERGPLFNQYLIENYKVTSSIRMMDTNCTENITILDQTVSEHFCQSNKRFYSYMDGELITH